MRKTIGLILIFLLPLLVGYLMIVKEANSPSKLQQLKESRLQKEKPGADHSHFSQLQVKFERPQDVTLACIGCHNERHTEVMNTVHWRWLRDEYMEDKGVVSLGKRNILNNFCVSVSGSEGSCSRCHIGYGYDSKDFDFTKEENIDCLACHDNSGKYEKEVEAAGYPKKDLDLAYISQHVGLPKKENCGNCHFEGGGGNNTKHGDLETALLTSDRDVDVHMAANGGNMECIDCHEAKNHIIKGRSYSSSSMDKNRLYCEDCHTNVPHKDNIINEHTAKVACQTCHIPIYAKVNKTKTFWDWSKATKLKNGEPYHFDDEDGNHTYLSEKGEFKWERNLKPEYVWFNGTAKHYLIEDTIKEIPLVLNPLGGNYKDLKAKIYPTKIMRTIQPYDPVQKKLVSFKLWDKEKGNNSLWKDFNWAKAIDSGMKYLNLPWSGQYDFIETQSYWLTNHMVAPKEKTVKCNECHTRSNGRLENIKDMYLPGRDFNPTIDRIGIALIILTFFGVATHSAIRIYYSNKNKGQN